jgi:hypothetical protein
LRVTRLRRRLQITEVITLMPEVRVCSTLSKHSTVLMLLLLSLLLCLLLLLLVLLLSQAEALSNIGLNISRQATPAVEIPRQQTLHACMVACTADQDIDTLTY